MTAERFTEFGVLVEAPCGKHVDEYGTDYKAALHIMNHKARAPEQTFTLVRRLVQISPWTPMPGERPR